MDAIENGIGVDSNAGDASEAWPVWQRVAFRFFFVYLLLQITPWNWFAGLPPISSIPGYWYRLVNWAVHESNRRIFHVRETLVAVNGSGDTSWAWTQLWLFLTVAAISCVVWSVLDRKRTSYPRLGYWLRTIVRYYIAVAALNYGIIKLFALQMSFPGLSQLATPLGDLLPMRLSWLFLGYSAKYQFFSGLMETLAGVLLLYRRTVTLGLLTAAGAFANVVMINMSYDVPVKLYASHLLFACLFLLLWDAKRLVTILVLNRPVAGTTAYEPPFHKRWQRGIALYYAGRYQDCRAQFESHRTVNPNDVENAAWHFLCVARAESADKAKAAILPVGPDARVPMRQVYEMLRGAMSPDMVLKAAGARDSAQFYAQLYVGLYYEALGDSRRALEHITLAAADRYADEGGYMHTVAKVHLGILRRR